MTLQDIFDHLTFGELSQLHIGGGETAGITEENYYNVITHVNLGLTALHKRFFLRKGEENVYVMPAIATYTITASDMFKIEQVFTEEGYELPIGTGQEDSVSMDGFNVIRVPAHIRLLSKPLRVVYRADHPTLDRRTASREPNKTIIDLPASHMEPLLYFIASRVFNPISANIEFHEGNNYSQKFEMACRALENQGMQIQEAEFTNRFDRNGWI